MTDWFEITRRNARSVQTTIGWIFWDPGAVARYEALGLPADFAGPLGYIGARAAPLAVAGPAAVIAAFGSISPLGIQAVFDLLGDPARFADLWAARDAAVVEGLQTAPAIVDPLVEHGPARASSSSSRPWAERSSVPTWRCRRPTPPARLARGELPARVARRHPLGPRRGRWTDPPRGLDPAQRLARLRARLAGPLAGHHAGRHRRRLGGARTQGPRRRSRGDGSRSRTAPTDRGRHRSPHDVAVGAVGGDVSNDLADLLEPPCSILTRVDVTAGPSTNRHPTSAKPPRAPPSGPPPTHDRMGPGAEDQRTVAGATWRALSAPAPACC
jgi:hypothetical protein